MHYGVLRIGTRLKRFPTASGFGVEAVVGVQQAVLNRNSTGMALEFKFTKVYNMYVHRTFPQHPEPF